jgi:transcriptional regulator with XRE-family HTH domain
MKFGEFVHAARIKRGLTLREFCRINELDPGNWSRIERGLQAPVKSRTILEEIARTLGFEDGSDEWQTLFELASIGFIPRELLDDAAIVDKLPVFFRTLRGEKPSKEELERLIEKIRGS